MKAPHAHAVILFFIVTFSFSWGLWMLMILSQRGFLPFNVPTHWSGSFGPALGAVVAIGWSGCFIGALWVAAILFVLCARKLFLARNGSAAVWSFSRAEK